MQLLSLFHALIALPLSVCLLYSVGASAESAITESSEVRFTKLLQTVQEQRSVNAQPGQGGVVQCPELQWTSGEYAIQRAGRERKFRVHVPAGYDPQRPAPLIVAFHGWGGDALEFLGRSIVTSELDRRGFILLAPVGLGPEELVRSPASWSFSGSTTGLDGDGKNTGVADDTDAICDDDRTTDYTYSSCAAVAANGCSWTQCSDNDLDYAVSLVRVARENLCVDTARVYAVGGSNGGMFTWDLGREPTAAETFRAIAPIIGLPHRGYLEPPVRDGGMPVLSITGVNDPTVPPGAWGDKRYTTTSDGDVYYYTGASAITEVWAEAHGCDIASSPQPVDVGAEGVDCRGWRGCSADSPWPPVLDCRSTSGHIYGLNWSWPLVLDFFDQHR